MTSSEAPVALAEIKNGNGCSRFGAAFRQLLNNLFGRPPVPAVPYALINRMDALRQMIKAGGPGSDMAFSELKGMQNTLMWLGQ